MLFWAVYILVAAVLSLGFGTWLRLRFGFMPESWHVKTCLLFAVAYGSLGALLWVMVGGVPGNQVPPSKAGTGGLPAPPGWGRIYR